MSTEQFPPTNPEPGMKSKPPSPEATALMAPPGNDTPLGAGLLRNIDLIMDIELGLTVSFGQNRLLLRDVLQLGTGSIIELDRQADEYVDLWVNNKKVARGEVVIVGGNYGVRITEVESVAERISTLGG